MTDESDGQIGITKLQLFIKGFKGETYSIIIHKVGGKYNTHTHNAFNEYLLSDCIIQWRLYCVT